MTGLVEGDAPCTAQHVQLRASNDCNDDEADTVETANASNRTRLTSFHFNKNVWQIIIFIYFFFAIFHRADVGHWHLVIARSRI